MNSDSISFTLNGKPVQLRLDNAATLLAVIREVFGLTGTKYNCEQGECGACTVLVDGRAINSCITSSTFVQNKSVETIESLVQDPAAVCLRDSFDKHDAVQCGYCTPGMIISATSLLRQTVAPSTDEIKAAIGGNYCRCTGYASICRAIHDASDRMRESGRVRNEMEV